jgi:hypothetical protein
MNRMIAYLVSLGVMNAAVILSVVYTSVDSALAVDDGALNDLLPFAAIVSTLAGFWYPFFWKEVRYYLVAVNVVLACLALARPLMEC